MFASTIQSYIQLNLFAPIRHDGTSTDFVMFKLNQIIKRNPNNPFEKYVNTTDQNAAINILAAGHAITACGVGMAQLSMTNQEPAYSTVEYN